jgi:hypothetical protein
MSPPTVFAIFELRRLRRHFRNQSRLQVARELELIAIFDFVDQLHREQKRQNEKRRHDLDECDEWRMLHLREDRTDADEERDP